MFKICRHGHILNRIVRNGTAQSAQGALVGRWHAICYLLGRMYDYLKQMALKEFGTLDDVRIDWDVDAATGRLTYVFSRPLARHLPPNAERPAA